MPTDFRVCLSSAPTAALFRIGKHYAVPVGHERTRASALARLHDAPLPRLVQTEAAKLFAGDDAGAAGDGEAKARRALRLIALCGGGYDRAAFEGAFGPCTVPRAGPIGLDPIAPWLAERGLVFALADRVVVPAEVLERIPVRAFAQNPDQGQIPMVIATPLYDLVMLLIAAQRGDLNLDRRTGQPRARVIDALLQICSAPASAASLRFIARLAVAARILAPAYDHLRPGPALDVWLALDPSAQLAALWHAWTALPPPQARRTRRDGRPHPWADTCSHCSHLRAALVQALTTASAADAAGATDPASPTGPHMPPPVAVTDAPAITCVVPRAELVALWATVTCVRGDICPAAHHDDDMTGHGSQAALVMLAGPLYWLGVCVSRATPRGDIAVSLTPAGQVLLIGKTVPRPSTPWRYADERGVATPGAATPGVGLRLAVPSDAPCAALLRLADLASPVHDAPGLWRLDPARAAATLAVAGVESPRAFFETMTVAPLPPRWRRALDDLATRAPAVTVASVLLLESRDPLPRTVPALSRLLARTISPRAAVVHARDLPALRRALARRGVELRVGDIGTEAVPAHPVRDVAHDPLQASRRRRIALATGLALLHALDSQGLPVPPLPAASALDLTEDERTASALWSRRLLARLADAAGTANAGAGTADPNASHTIAPDDAPAVDNTAITDLDALRAALAKAIADGAALRLRYAAPDGEPAWRLVEPHRLESRRGRTYLRAYCRDRRDERTFRLDRISAYAQPHVAAPPGGRTALEGW